MISKNEVTKSLNQVIKQKDEVIVLYSDISKLLCKFENNNLIMKS